MTPIASYIAARNGSQPAPGRNSSSSSNGTKSVKKWIFVKVDRLPFQSRIDIFFARVLNQVVLWFRYVI